MSYAAAVKKMFYIIFSILLIFSCSKKEYTGKTEQDYTTIGPQVNGDWLILSLNAEPSTLNLITATDYYASIINSYIYETLIRRDNETLEFIPWLAHKWEVSPDKLQFTFYMRKGIKWHDGKEITARDVIFSYNKMMDPKVDAPHIRNYYRDIKKVEMLDNYTIKFTYMRPYFRALEICGEISIVPEHIFRNGDFNNHPNGRHPVGTGPYIFEKWETGKKVVLTRNPGYWNKEKEPRINKMVFNFITDDNAKLQLLKKGDIDFSELTPIQWAKQTGSKKFLKTRRKLKYYALSYSYIGWNSRKIYFKDRDVREAMTRLIDRENILKNLRYGLGKITTGNFYIFSKDYDKTVQPYGYDPAKARELLAKAGWIDKNNDGILEKDGRDFKFTFLIPNGSVFAEQLATILKENLKKAGIIMDIRKLEWATFIQQVQDRRFDATTMAWSLSLESDPFQLWHSSQTDKGSNYTGFVNKRVDELIEKGRQEYDPGKRAEMFREIHRILHYEQPYSFLFSGMALLAIDRRFQNTKIYNPIGVDCNEWWVPDAIQKYKD